MTHFIGKPCKKCGETLRYARDKGCVACQRAHDKARASRMSAEERELL